MRIGVVTSRGCIYPSLRYPQYLDQENCFRSLSAQAELVLVGHILERREYAAAQLSFSSLLNQLPSVWNNRYAAALSALYPVTKIRDGLDSFSDALYTQSCFSYLSRRRVDVIYAFPWPFDRYVARWANKLNKPLVIEMWEDYACFARLQMISLGLPPSTVAREVGRQYRWMRDISRAADRVIVPSRVLADRLQDMGVEGGKIRIIPVCVDPSLDADPRPVRLNHNLNDGEKVVFHIGGAASWHDLPTLIKSVPYIKSPFVFIIAGGRNPQVEREAATLAPGNVRVIFTGRIEDSEVGAYLAAADICVAPYRFPHPSGFFPAKVIRYMLAGKAIVATDTPEIREMLQGREAGILVPPEDPSALAAVINSLAADSRMRRRMGSVAREIAENSYLIRHHTEKLTEVFKEVT